MKNMNGFHAALNELLKPRALCPSSSLIVVLINRFCAGHKRGLGGFNQLCTELPPSLVPFSCMYISDKSYFPLLSLYLVVFCGMCTPLLFLF